MGKRGKLGGPTDGMLGIEDWEGESAETIIQDAINQFVEDYKKENMGKTPTSYSSDIWFKYVKRRKPVIIIYLVDVESDKTQIKQAKQFRNEMDNIPVVGLAMGLPKSDNVALISKNKYKANKYYNWFEKDEIIAESEEEE